MVKIRASRSSMMGWWASKCIGRECRRRPGARVIPGIPRQAAGSAALKGVRARRGDRTPRGDSHAIDEGPGGGDGGGGGSVARGGVGSVGGEAAGAAAECARALGAAFAEP